jgi:E3 ubiquitin-protein ligase SIAH1
MAKFSFDDAEDDPPAAASGGEKRKREDDTAEAGGGPLKARILGAGDVGPGGSAAVTEERVGGSGWDAVVAAGGDADGAISVRIDPEVLDCSICFEPLRPPLYQVPPLKASLWLLKLPC